MKKYICKAVRKELSRFKNKNGTKIEQLIKSLEITKKIESDLILQIVKLDNNLEFLNQIVKLKESFYLTQEFLDYEKELYNFNYIKNLFKEEANQNILNVYKLIVDYDILSYTQISNYLLSLYGKKLDIKQVAHYCKELKNFNLINSEVNTNNNNEKVITKREINYNPKPVIQENKVMEEPPLSDTFQINKVIDPIKILELNQDDNKNILECKNPKNYYDNRFTFLIDESNIQNNILFHLSIRDKGLTLNAIALLLGMLGREKSIGRLLNNMTEKGLIINKAMREGKKYEYVYMLNKEIDEYVSYYVNYYKKDKNNMIIDAPIKLENDSYDLVELNNTDYLFIVEIIQQNNKYSELRKRYNLCNIANIKKDLLLDFFNSNSEFNANKSFSNISYNRHLFCLNKIQEFRILSALELRRYVMDELENKKDYSIDRKTLKKILVNLENFGLIKLIEYELTMTNKDYEYQKNKECIKQSKVYVLRRDVNETDDLIKDIEKEIKNSKSKKSPNDETTLQLKSETIVETEYPEFKISDLVITSLEKRTRKFMEIMTKITNRNRLSNSTKSSFYTIKKYAFILKNLTYIFSKQDNFNEDEIYLHKLIEDNTPPRILMPSYMTNNIINNLQPNLNYLKSESMLDYNNNNDSLIPYLNIQETINSYEKRGLNDLNIEDKLFCNFFFNVNKRDKDIILKRIDKPLNILESLKYTKRKRSRKSNFENKPDLCNILSNIYFTPRIAYKKLRNSFPSNHEACIDFLQYFNKHEYLSLNKKSNTEISFELDESISKYLKFN